jgi:glycerophosphoryl diester phosphodiesterase
VIHDETTKRTTGVDFKVADHSLNDLRKLDAGAWKGAQWKGEKLPTLEEVIAAIPAGKQLLIEIKAGPEVMPELKRVIRASGKEKQVLLQSFGFPTCVAARKAFPRLPVHLLVAALHNPLTGAWSPSIVKAAAKAQKAGLHGMGANDTPLVDASSVQKLHSAGMKMNIWTVDEVDAAQRLIALGVDGLITNRPGWLKAQLLRKKGADIARM